MQSINNYIIEKLLFNQSLDEKLLINKDAENCCPKTTSELRNIIEKRLAKDKNANLNDIDVSKINDMEELFYNLDPHNIDISEWDVSNVTDMHRTFSECENFNCDLSKWNVSNVEMMFGLFYDCKKFTGKGLENWDVSNVKDMGYIFDGCISLKNKPSWYKE